MTLAWLSDSNKKLLVIPIMDSGDEQTSLKNALRGIGFSFKHNLTTEQIFPETRLKSYQHGKREKLYVFVLTHDEKSKGEIKKRRFRSDPEVGIPHIDSLLLKIQGEKWWRCKKKPKKQAVVMQEDTKDKVKSKSGSKSGSKSETESETKAETKAETKTGFWTSEWTSKSLMAIIAILVVGGLVYAVKRGVDSSKNRVLGDLKPYEQIRERSNTI